MTLRSLPLSLALLALVVTGCDAVGPEAPATTAHSMSQYGGSTFSYTVNSTASSYEQNGFGGNVQLSQSIVTQQGTQYFRLVSPREIFYTNADDAVVVTCGTNVFLSNGNSFPAEAGQSASDATVVRGPGFGALIPRGLPAASGGPITVTRTCVTTNQTRPGSASFSASTVLVPAPQP